MLIGLMVDKVWPNNNSIINPINCISILNKISISNKNCKRKLGDYFNILEKNQIYLNKCGKVIIQKLDLDKDTLIDFQELHFWWKFYQKQNIKTITAMCVTTCNTST